MRRTGTSNKNLEWARRDQTGGQTLQTIMEPVSIYRSYAGCLKLFYTEWLRVTSNHFILNWVKGYSIPFSTLTKQTHVPATRNFETSKRLQLIAELKKLLKRGAIEICNPLSDQILSRIFLASKPNDKNRFILKLKLKSTTF